MQVHIADGLKISWAHDDVSLDGVPIRVRIEGSHVFRVWSQVDSGEDAPAWAEPELAIELFSGSDLEIDRWDNGVRVIDHRDRVTATLELCETAGELELGLSLSNPQPESGRSLPLCLAELSLGGLPGTEYASAHAYGGRTHGWGTVAGLDRQGVPFIHGCIGLSFPLVYLYEPQARRGLQFEFMQEGRPFAWLGKDDHDAACWRQQWHTHRLLLPGETHAFGGKLRIKPFTGRPVEQIWRWRDAAQQRYGLNPVPAPDWARHANIVEFNTHPIDHLHPFQRLDDPRVYDLLKRWQAMGYTAIFTVGHNNTGTHFLSPYDYEPCQAAGGHEAERQYLAWAHELGFAVFLWVTTVGMERRAPEVAAHPDWWTRRRDGSLFYAWDSNPETGHVGYAPDGDPLSTGWRAWLRDQVTSVIRRGYEGIFVDGCIPRADNHARWRWPGEGRNGVADQVKELCDHMRSLGPGLAVLLEDQGLYAMACAEVSNGRYCPVPPYYKKAHWDHGMGGGPEAAASPPARIPPERARDYLLLRYASALPGVVHKEGNEGYYSEAMRPWCVQMLLAGMVPKTHSCFVDDAIKWQAMPEAPEPPPEEKTPSHRQRGHEEFVRLLHLVRDNPDLLRQAPLTIDGVAVQGDEAVVGILRPTRDRCFLAVIQFAGRSAKVNVALRSTGEIPETQRGAAGAFAQHTWRCREILRSMVDEAAKTPEATLAPDKPLPVRIAPYGFRVFELTRSA